MSAGKNKICAFFLVFLSLFFSQSVSLTLSGIGSTTFWPVVRHWSNAYQSVDSTFDISFDITNTIDAVEELIDGLHGKLVDFAIIDFLKANSTEQEMGFEVFPILQTALVPQINLPGIPNIALRRDVLAQIYLGNITNWNDSAIAATNPNISLPNATIQVFFRDSQSSFNLLWSTGLSAWSETWNKTYGVNMTFPDTLRALPTFHSQPTVLFVNAAVAVTPYSIGYVPYFLVKRDPVLTYAMLIHSVTGRPVSADQLDVNAPASNMPLNKYLEASYDIDSKNPSAWPITSYVYVMYATPSDCDSARAMFKFFNWALNDHTPREATINLGCQTMGDNITETILHAMSTTKCKGKEVGYFQDAEHGGALAETFLILSILAFVCGLVLSGIHIYHFSKTHINTVYSLVFIVGTALTLLSPTFWYLTPSTGICLGRIWTGSLGFTILLATMFSRTWQLNDIYTLQKQNDKMDHLRKSAQRTLLQFASILISVIVINFLIVLIWSVVDPLTPKYVVVDRYTLTGYWTCSCTHTTAWLLLELLFFLTLLCFGIYVIYRTWSFQRQVLLTETRWVLVALYNIIMNLAAVAPILSFLTVTENVLSIIAIISIDISGGSIICAVLLPRIVSKIEESTHKGSHGSNRTDVQAPIIPKRVPQMKREISRTPEDELARRLQEPTPLKLQTHHEKDDELEMQPLHHRLESSDVLDISTSHNIMSDVTPQKSQFHGSSPAILEESEKEELHIMISGSERQSQRLTWNSNPINLELTPNSIRPLTPTSDDEEALGKFSMNQKQ